MSNYKLTDAQKAILRESMNSPISEKVLCEKLGMDEQAFAGFIRNEKRESVFRQAMSEEELEAAAGGKFDCANMVKFLLCGVNAEPEPYPCVDNSHRGIYDGGFPNCAATVEDGSWCLSNDACYNIGIIYDGMTECHKAWK